jgi:DNA/RNA endonuclease YhcR with UshA esterase domain
MRHLPGAPGEGLAGTLWAKAGSEEIILKHFSHNRAEMQKEEKIVFVLLLMALGSLVVAFWAFAPDESTAAILGAKGENEVLQTGVSLEGRIVSLKTTQSGGHLLISLDSTPIPIFISSNSGAEELLSRLKTGNNVRVKGISKVFQGKEEIEVSRSSDLQLMN